MKGLPVKLRHMSKLDLQIKDIALSELWASASAHCEKDTGYTIAILDRLKHE